MASRRHGALIDRITRATISLARARNGYRPRGCPGEVGMIRTSDEPIKPYGIRSVQVLRIYTQSSEEDPEQTAAWHIATVACSSYAGFTPVTDQPLPERGSAVVASLNRVSRGANDGRLRVPMEYPGGECGPVLPENVAQVEAGQVVDRGDRSRQVMGTDPTRVGTADALVTHTLGPAVLDATMPSPECLKQNRRARPVERRNPCPAL